MRKPREVTPEPNPREPMPFTVFDAGTGAILRSGCCQRQSLHQQTAGSDEIVLEGNYPDDRYRIEVTENGPVAVAWTAPLVVTIEMVRTEARRRIELAYPLWRQINLNREGGEAADAMNAFIDGVRAASNALAPDDAAIPDDYADNKWWS
jgi:hypothetical protein